MHGVPARSCSSPSTESLGAALLTAGSGVQARAGGQGEVTVEDAQERALQS